MLLMRSRKGAKKEPKRSRKGAEEEPKRSQKGAKKELNNGIERKRAVLDILGEKPEMTQVQLMEGLDLTRRQIQKAIKELQEEGSLIREGSNRNGRWIVVNLENETGY